MMTLGQQGCPKSKERGGGEGGREREEGKEGGGKKGGKERKDKEKRERESQATYKNAFSFEVCLLFM